MKYFGSLLLVVILGTSCSRQPVRVDAGPVTTVPAASTGPAAEPKQKTEDALAARKLDGTKQGTAPAEKSGEFVPEEAEVKAMRREQVRSRRENMGRISVDDNQTATSENQGSLGQAPLTPADSRVETTDEEAPMFSFKKSNCYGDCESYTFDLRSGGLTSLAVNKGRIAEGLYKRELYSVDYANLNSDIDSLRMLDLAPIYPVGEDIPADIPFRSITLLDAEGNPRTVQVYYGAPPGLERFLDRLEALIDEQSWERTREPAKND